MKMDDKYERALEVASGDRVFVSQHKNFHRMTRQNLYTALSGRGYDWSVELQKWVPRQTLQFVAPQHVQQVKAHAKTLNNVFLVRIMAPNADIPKIEAELFELAEALNWTVERSTREYENDGEGFWVRKYYTVKRG